MNSKLIFKFLFISLLILSLSGCGHTKEHEPETDQTEKESITVATWKTFGVDVSKTNIAHLIGDTYYMASWEWDLENMLMKNIRIDRTSVWGEGIQYPGNVGGAG